MRCGTSERKDERWCWSKELDLTGFSSQPPIRGWIFLLKCRKGVGIPVPSSEKRGWVCGDTTASQQLYLSASEGI